MKKNVMIAGIVSGVVMAMVEMMYEGIWGAGFWAPPTFIAGLFMKSIQTVAIPVPLLPGALMLGMMIHMVTSIALAMVFVLLVSRFFTSRIALVVAGAMYGLIVFGVMRSVALPIIDPVMLKLSPVMFTMSHMMWGGVIGWFVYR